MRRRRHADIAALRKSAAGAAACARTFALALALVCALGLSSARAADPPKHEIVDPHYGDVLWHFYQDQYFTSITTLMVSEHFDRVQHHADEAEVLRGGMLLSYGMPKEAGTIFAQLIEKGASPPVRDRCWYYLAKIRYQRGYLEDAEQAMAHIEHSLPPALEEDRGLLLANLLMARSDYAGAAAILGAMKEKTPGARYVRYNLGVAFMKSGDKARGTELLDALGRAGAENEEYRSLRDRANVALGFSALNDSNPKMARAYLERVRLNSLQSNKALLGFGWAAAALKDPKLALVPWTELAQRDVGDSAALEAQIAVPFAYAELGAYGQSLEHYNDAISAFDRENRSLDESVRALRTGKWVDALIDRNPGDEMGWFWRIGDLPQLPHERHLSQLLAEHEFQEAFKNYRDLRYLTQNLEEWRDKLVVFNDMLLTRRKAFADRLPLVRARAGELGIETAEKKRDKIAAQITAGVDEGDGKVFADEKEVELLARLDSVNQALTKAEAAPEAGVDLPALRNRARLVGGALSWQLSQQFSYRSYQAGKDLAEIDGGLTDAKRRDAELAQAQRDEPARFERFAVRIAAVLPLLQAMIPRVAVLSNEQRIVVQDIAVAELLRQKERLAEYTTQARFSVAELYDRANLKKDAEHAPKP